MTLESTAHERATVEVENVGGISSAEVDFEPGLTVLAGRNATNRTSLLQAIRGALGSDKVTLRSGADRGYVELSLGDETATRELTRQNGTVVVDGSPHLDGSQARTADLFAFLLESNEARRAVEQGKDLRDLLMEPVDTAAIEREIDRLIRNRSTVDDRLEELDSLERKLPPLSERRTTLEGEIEELTDELEEKRRTLEETEGSVEAQREERTELDERVNELESARNEHKATKRNLQTERRSIESLESERAELEAELADLSADPERSPEDLEAELSRLRSRRQRLTNDLTQLQSIVQFNEEMLDGDGGALTGETVGESRGPDELLPEGEQEAVCWTCGTEVERNAIEETIDGLRSLRESMLDERRELNQRIEDLESTRKDIESHRADRERLETRIESNETELENRRERVEELEARRDELAEAIDELEEAVEELHREENDDLLDLNREVNRLEFELEDRETTLEDVEAEIAGIEDQLDEREELETRREELGEEITELRTRVERLEREAVDAFNDHMAELLDILEYDNLDRVWIESVERTVQDGRSRVSKTQFDLHIVRENDDGVAHEDTIDHLSESERELIGLVFGLAGYLVHDVHEDVPFMLLDSLEAIDADRIDSILSYFADYAEYLVVALLSEDAAAVTADHDVVTEI